MLKFSAGKCGSEGNEEKHMRWKGGTEADLSLLPGKASTEMPQDVQIKRN